MRKKFRSHGLTSVVYKRCVNCGFVQSETHLLMSEVEWVRLNEAYHTEYLGSTVNVDDPAWTARLSVQAAVIADLSKLGVLPRSMPWLDYGCGDGKLSDMLEDQYGLPLRKFDRHLHTPGSLSEEEIAPSSFDLVVATSVFEHLLDRRSLDEVASLVGPLGVLCVHTSVVEHIPDDPDWYYLLPVHCSFFTSKSMQILFEEWGFSASVYCPNAGLWFMIKGDAEAIEAAVGRANARRGAETMDYEFCRGFVGHMG